MIISVKEMLCNRLQPGDLLVSLAVSVLILCSRPPAYKLQLVCTTTAKVKIKLFLYTKIQIVDP